MPFHIPSFREIHDILFDEERCICFLMETGILKGLTTCNSCGAAVTRYGKLFHCCQYRCKKAVSIFHSTFFAGARIKCNSIMHLGYLWLSGCNSSTILAQTGHSKKTVAAFLGHFRQLVAETLDSDDNLVGGPGIIVQVDETKMGKRKFHRGHRVDGAWVIAGVELTSRRGVFAEVVEDRSEATIVDVLRRHIADGSVLWTDCWKSYTNISRIFGIEHKTVNHSKCFRDPATGVHTNVIEGTNYALKRAIPPRNRTKEHLQEHLFEFIWRRKWESNLWEGFLKALSEIEYDN